MGRGVVGAGMGCPDLSFIILLCHGFLWFLLGLTILLRYKAPLFTSVPAEPFFPAYKRKICASGGNRMDSPRLTLCKRHFHQNHMKGNSHAYEKISTSRRR